MPLPDEALRAAHTLRGQVDDSGNASKKLRIRTLLKKFGYRKRSDSNTAKITAALDEVGLSVSPSIMRFGDEWGLSTEDWVYLSSPKVLDKADNEVSPANVSPPPAWDADGWFDQIVVRHLRTEKEVEIKFIVPLLSKLGYLEEDRYDGMPIRAASGSRTTTLVIDFALFNAGHESLRNQPLLTVEAKREHRLVQKKEVTAAHNQAKSYSLWTQCDFFMVTDSRVLQIFDLTHRGLRGPAAEEPVFTCERAELKGQFPKLCSLVSKDVLTQHYLARLATTEEVR